MTSLTTRKQSEGLPVDMLANLILFRRLSGTCPRGYLGLRVYSRDRPNQGSSTIKRITEQSAKYHNTARKREKFPFLRLKRLSSCAQSLFESLKVQNSISLADATQGSDFRLSSAIKTARHCLHLKKNTTRSITQPLACGFINHIK